MIDDLEDRLRAAAPDAPPLDGIDQLHARAAQRGRTRRRVHVLFVASVTVLLVVALVTSLLALRGTDPKPAGRVDTAVPHITWARVPGPGTIHDVVSGHGTTVAVGSVGEEAAIWTSKDAVSWIETYVRPTTAEVAPTPPCPARCETPVQSNFLAIAYGSGRFVALGTRNGAASGQRGFIMVSTDGSTWTDADDKVFEPLRKPESNLSTLPRHIAFFHGEFVIVGDVYSANTKQQSGLSPALWTSHDGLRWTRRILDLGSGSDPYMDTTTVGHGLLVASGGYEHGYGVWITRDLHRWSFHRVSRHGGLSIVAAARDFVAGGSTCVPTKRCNRRVAQHVRGQPTLWYSSDGRAWRVVLRLRSGAEEPGGVGTGLGPVGMVDDTTVALGVRGQRGETPAETPLVYVSTDGRRWVDDRDAAVFPDGSAFTGSGTRGDELLVAGTVDGQPVMWIGRP